MMRFRRESTRQVFLLISLFLAGSIIAVYRTSDQASQDLSAWLPSPLHRFLETRRDRVQLLASVESFIERYPRDWPVTQWTQGRKDTLLEADALRTCLKMGNCRGRQTDIVIGGSFHFGNALHGGTGGEDIWARSTIDALHNIGHTILYAYGPFEVLHMHRSFGDAIKLAFMENEDIEACVQGGMPRLLSAKEAADGNRFATMTTDEARRLSGLHGLGIDFSEKGAEEAAEQTAYGWKKMEGSGADGEWSDDRCIKRESFEEGLPLRKLFAFHFWSDPVHYLGANWTVSPETDGKNRYIGYSVERYCKQIPFVRAEDRADRAFIYGKQGKYFSKGSSTFNDGSEPFRRIADELQIKFSAAAGEKGSPVGDSGITNFGRFSPEGFYEHLSQSKLLVSLQAPICHTAYGAGFKAFCTARQIGVGNPPISPTPYEALCLGVPFINPILGRNKGEPMNRWWWWTQHHGLKNIEEPYVYHVPRDNFTALEEAVEKARRNPIERFIPPAMTEEATAERHTKLIDWEWREAYADAHAAAAAKKALLQTVLP